MWTFQHNPHEHLRVDQLTLTFDRLLVKQIDVKTIEKWKRQKPKVHNSEHDKQTNMVFGAILQQLRLHLKRIVTIKDNIKLPTVVFRHRWTGDEMSGYQPKISYVDRQRPL